MILYAAKTRESCLRCGKKLGFFTWSPKGMCEHRVIVSEKKEKMQQAFGSSAEEIVVFDPEERGLQEVKQFLSTRGS